LLTIGDDAAKIYQVKVKTDSKRDVTSRKVPGNWWGEKFFCLRNLSQKAVKSGVRSQESEVRSQESESSLFLTSDS
ncbi:MAG: hypothetical protein AAFV72_22445, partial [Cyanobacteria bacterium J06635_1]